MEGPDESEVWRSARELAWAPPGWSLVKAPLTPGRIIPLERSLAGTPALRRYSAGGNVAWIASPEPPVMLDLPLSTLGLSGLVLFGPPGQPRLGARMGEVFARRVKDALDPSRRFVEV